MTTHPTINEMTRFSRQLDAQRCIVCCDDECPGCLTVDQAHGAALRSALSSLQRARDEMDRAKLALFDGDPVADWERRYALSRQLRAVKVQLGIVDAVWAAAADARAAAELQRLHAGERVWRGSVTA